MSDDLVVGVDLGTTGAKAALYTAAGELLGEATAATPLRWHGPGHADQDPEDFVAAAAATIAACVEQGGARGRIAALGVGGQMAGILGVGADGAASTPYDSWLDTRCAGDVAWLEAELGDELAARTGCPAMVDHGPKLRWWRREQPAAFERTAAWLTPSGYVAGRLAGLPAEAAFMDTSHLHFTALADATAAAWSPDLAAALGVPLDRLPRIVAPTEVVGALTPRAAEACGLPAGTPVAAGLGDTAAGALGAGVVRPGQLLDLAGTAAVLAGSAREFRPDVARRTLITMRGAVPGQWISLAYLSGGGLLGWLGDVVLGEAGEEGDDVARLDLLCAEAGAVPAGAGGLLFLPYLDGRVLPSDPALRGGFVGLRRHHRRPHLARAVLESVALEYLEYLELLRELHPELTFDETRAAGGGARSAVWNAIKASTLGVPHGRLGRAELGCWGAALVAAAAVGLVDDLAEAAAAATPIRALHEPSPAEGDVLRALLPTRRELVAAAARASDALARAETQTLTQEVTA